MGSAQEKAQTAIDKRRGTSNASTIKNMLEQQSKAIALALPRHMNPDRMVRVAWGCISRNDKLLKCKAASLIRCILQASELGLEPSNVLGHAYLVPFKNEATLIVGYKGFVELAARGGQARFRPPRVVYSTDNFLWQDGLVQKLEHTPMPKTKDSKITHAYVCVDFANGLPPMCDVMTVDEIESIRKSSPYGNKGPWKEYYEEMCKKTVVRRCAKFTPLSPELQVAAAEDEAREFGDAIEADFELTDPDPETGEMAPPEREPGQEG